MSIELSYASRRYLTAIKDGVNPAAYVSGQAAYGGLESTRNSLLRKGLIADEGGETVLTEAGVRALGEIRLKG